VSFFEELKRRNVFKVGIAYAVGAWLLLQLTEVLSELLKLPDTIGPIVVSVVAIGFPIVIFFAWAFELTPEGVKREAEVDRTQSIAPQTGKKLNAAIFVMMALAIVYLLYDKFSGPEATGVEAIQQSVDAASQSEEAATPAGAAEINPKSIAVLPFDNRSRNEDDEFFVEGVHDDLLTNLARIGSLKVISRTSVSKYKATEKTIPEIAAELGVATVMEGAVQRSGNTVRINVQLIDAQTDEHLWAEIFDREMTANNLFAIQTEISERIAEALKTTLSPEEQERISDRPTENLAAYNSFLRGRLLQSRRNSKDLDQAAVEFGRAVELDPQFALAWVGVADTAMLRTSYSNLGIVESLKIREDAVRRALELNDQLGEAHLSQAMLHSFHERNEEAEASFLKAIELSPNYARAYQWYADFVAGWPARATESLRLTEQAVQLDPLSSIIRYEIAEKLVFLGRFGEAEARINELIESDPEFPVFLSAMAGIKNVTGHIDEQVFWLYRKLELDPGDITEYQNLVFAMLDMGNHEAIPELRQAMEEIDDEHVSLGFVDIFENVYQQNYQAAFEAGNWVDSQIGKQPSFQNFFGFLHTLNGDYFKAREAFTIAEPRFFERASFRAAIEQQTTQGCLNAWIMMRTGDQSLGEELLGMTIDYIENELPQYMEHADRFGYPGCYLASGDHAKALDAFETQVAHGHIGGWWVNTRMPWFEPLRGEPRFEAALQSIRDRMAVQRENLARMEAQAGP
jgi:TolB-like protein/Tfp pilus assembly protein PilF